MIKEAEYHEEEEDSHTQSQEYHLNTNGTDNKAIINIIDYQVDRPESQLEESSSSFSKSQRIEMINTHNFSNRHTSSLKLLEFVNSDIDEKPTYIAESFKSTAMAQPELLQNQICKQNS